MSYERSAATWAFVALSGSVSAEAERGQREIQRPAVEFSAPPAGVRAGGPDDEAELVREARLDTILRVALARNPELHEGRERVRAAMQRTKAASRLPDLQFKYEQWAVPLGRPWALDEAGMLMWGLEQTFPAPGSLSARERMAHQDAKILIESQRGRELDVIAKLRRAYYDYTFADWERRVHVEMIDVTMRMGEIARVNYLAGRATQQDVLRLLVETSRHHNDLAGIESLRHSSRAMLNALMARAPDAPLGPAPDLEPKVVDLRAHELRGRLEQRSPALIAAGRSVERGQAELDEAQSRARWPSFMVGADYWYMPAQDSPHAYGAMLSLNLPWFNPGHREEVRAAERTLAADREALLEVRSAAHFELEDAMARYDAARESYTIIDRDLLGQAQKSFESAE